MKCKICGWKNPHRWPSRRGMDALRHHYKLRHGGWKRPATRDRRYKHSSESESPEPEPRFRFCPRCGERLA